MLSKFLILIRYESAATFIKPTKKSSGQLGSPSDKTEVAEMSASGGPQTAEEKKERGEKTAENIRYGEAISEHGFGGETVGNSGGVESHEESPEDSRTQQGYGQGNDVGA